MGEPESVDAHAVVHVPVMTAYLVSLGWWHLGADRQAIEDAGALTGEWLAEQISDDFGVAVDPDKITVKEVWIDGERVLPNEPIVPPQAEDV